jgi:hypothetical protein
LKEEYPDSIKPTCFFGDVQGGQKHNASDNPVYWQRAAHRQAGHRLYYSRGCLKRV